MHTIAPFEEEPQKHAQIRGGGGGAGGPDPLKNRKNIGFLSNTGLKATKPAFHVGPPSAR